METCHRPQQRDREDGRPGRGDQGQEQEACAEDEETDGDEDVSGLGLRPVLRQFHHREAAEQQHRDRAESDGASLDQQEVTVILQLQLQLGEQLPDQEDHVQRGPQSEGAQ